MPGIDVQIPFGKGVTAKVHDKEAVADKSAAIGTGGQGSLPHEQADFVTR